MNTGAGMSSLSRPCVKCGTVIESGSYCEPCTPIRLRRDNRARRQDRGYDSAYDRARAEMIAIAWNRHQPCVICGKGFARKREITAEHLTPLRDGGGSDLANLGPAHAPCNSGWRRNL